MARALRALIGHLRQEIVEGGLGVFVGAFELRMERKQQELARSCSTIRTQLKELAPALWAIRSPTGTDVLRLLRPHSDFQSLQAGA